MNGVGAGVCPQHIQGGGELLARLAEAAPQAQRPPGGCLGAGRRPGLAALEMIIAGTAGVPDSRGPVSVGTGGLRGLFPQHAGVSLPVPGSGFACCAGQLGGGGIAGGGAGRGAGPLSALGGPDQHADRLAADLVGVRVAGHGLHRVQVVTGDDVGDLFAIAGEGGTQVRGHGQVAGLAVAAGQGVVGDLAQHVLGEAVAAPLRGQRVRGHAEHLPAYQVGQRRPHRGPVLPGDRDQRLGREGRAQHCGVGDQPPHARVQASSRAASSACRLPGTASSPNSPASR